MHSQPGAFVPRGVVYKSLGALLLMLFLAPVIQADDNASLNTDKPGACATLTVQWELTSVSFYAVEIVDNNAGHGQPLFITTVDSPTSSVQWVVTATPGAKLHLAVHSPPDLTSKHYKTADFQVTSGPTTCFPQVTEVR